MTQGQLTCWLYRLLGGKHAWRRLTKKEMQNPPMAFEDAPERGRICRRCGAERIAKARKKANPKPKL